MRRLLLRFVPAAPGGLGAPPYGYYGPCARSSLDGPGTNYAQDAQARPEAGKENAAVERRKAKRTDRKVRARLKSAD